MSWRCEHGIHAYRHLSIRKWTHPDDPGGNYWWQVIKCKRCGTERGKVRYHYPIIRSYDWGKR